MWKSIVLCVSLFSGAAAALTLGARYMEPAALPAAAAMGLCLIGVVLILSAPARRNEATAEPSRHSARAPSPVPEVDEVAVAPTILSTPTPPMPLEALH